MKDSKIVIVMCFILLICMGGWYSYNSFLENKIINKVESVDGEVTNIDYKIINKGPFIIFDKNTPIYKFEYIQHGEEKVGWVRFSPFKTTWKMDYEK